MRGLGASGSAERAEAAGASGIPPATELLLSIGKSVSAHAGAAVGQKDWALILGWSRL